VTETITQAVQCCMVQVLDCKMMSKNVVCYKAWTEDGCCMTMAQVLCAALHRKVLTAVDWHKVSEMVLQAVAHQTLHTRCHNYLESHNEHNYAHENYTITV
jgi:hypothetical protein